MQTLIHHAVDEKAGHHPGALATTFLEETLDYAGLAGASNRLAHALRENGVRHHDRVGIFMDKSLKVPVALYGIMKTGAAYVPLDPSAPAQRIADVIRDCGVHHVITAASKMRALRAISRFETPIECLLGVTDAADLPWRCVGWTELDDHRGDQPPGGVLREDDLAYIIYTSGSTGTPKGIMHTHRSGLSFARWAAAEYGLRADDRLSNHAPLHFDLSIFDFFAAAVAGAATVIIPEEHTRLPASYAQLLAQQRVSVLFTVPFALIHLLIHGAVEKCDLRALRWAIFGGEPFPPVHLRALMDKLPHVRFDNMYGPAEVNGVTHYTVPGAMDGETQIPIGPIARGAEALVVDATDRPVAQGQAGELLVCSPTMMQGYWGRADLNATAFYRRTRATGPEQVFFRTGDTVVDPGDGVFRFVGRKDRQVKIRGYRVELDEIELALTSNISIEEAAVYTLPDQGGSQSIHAQATPKNGADITSAALTKHLKSRLPWYAVPASIVIAQHFPRTTTGKIDRRRLREQAILRTSGNPAES